MKVNIEFDSATATQADHQLLNRLVSAINDADWPTAEAAVAAKPVGKATVKIKPEPEPEPAEDEEVVEAELVEAESEDSDEALMEQAVQKATKLVSDGKASDVKAALEKAGARRVSELKDRDSIRKFLEAL